MRRPDGIQADHAERPAWFGRHASPLSLLIFGAIVGAALLGLFGGTASVLRAESAAAFLELHTPTILRNGASFEMQVRVTAREPIGELVIGVDSGLWNNMAIDTLAPSAREESFQDGAFRFAFHPLKTGESFAMKVDLQINPDIRGGTTGRVVVYDERLPIVELPVQLEILP